MSDPNTVTVIVPIHSGVAEVRAGLLRLADTLVAGTTTADLLLIDDRGPDPAMIPMLESFVESAKGFEVELLVNSENLGFVATVNRGLDATAGDVVILNADTFVTDGWLDRLRDAAVTEPNVGTVTPLTNFGSLCTLPTSIINHFRLGSDDPRVDDCAEHVARCSLGLRPEVIAGVGFCMYVTRDCLDATGRLDVATFGKGYGEEVDFCLRATRLGFRHLVEDSTFVYHEGGGSFGDDRSERMAAASEIIHGRYPFFKATNSAERADDPLRVAQAALELGLSSAAVERPLVLQVLHSVPDALGGTQKHLATLLRALEDQFDQAVLFPTTSGFVLRTYIRTADGLVEHEHLLPGAATRADSADDEVAGAALLMAIDMVQPVAVHLQNLIGHTTAPLRALKDFEGSVVCSVRDLYLACPHHWLMYRNQEACGIPDDLNVCAQCLPTTIASDVEHLVELRASVAAHLDRVDHWVVANSSVMDYLRRVHDIADDKIRYIEHGAIVSATRRTRSVDRDLIRHEPLRLAFVGLGWPKKGLDVVNHLAGRLTDTDIEIHHFGLLKAPMDGRVIRHGEYDNEVLPDLLHRFGIQVVFLPGPFAETFGHVMTEALVTGRPVIGSAQGALGERIRRHGAGWTVDPSDWDATERLVRRLDRCRSEIERVSQAAADVPIVPVADTAPAYGALYLSHAAPGDSALTDPASDRSS